MAERAKDKRLDKEAEAVLAAKSEAVPEAEEREAEECEAMPSGDGVKFARPAKRTLRSQLDECGNPRQVYLRYYEGKVSQASVYNWARDYGLEWEDAREAKKDHRHRLK